MKSKRPPFWTVFATLSFALYAHHAWAWGPVGHRTVGEIAERHLAPEAKRALRALMGDESLAEASTWADEMRSDPAWKKANPWHYVNTAENEAYLDSKKAEGGDVIRAIVHFEDLLRDAKAPKAERVNAVRFLTHFIGDLHQPLHTGKAKDRGGNDLKVSWFKEETDLHHVWDDSMIDHKRLSFTELTRFIDRDDRAIVKKLQDSIVLDWHAESYALMPKCYEIGEGKLGWGYQFTHWPTVERRLYEAGVRLAGILNSALAPGGPKPLSKAGLELRKKLPLWNL